jgi:hypothetical protein
MPENGHLTPPFLTVPNDNRNGGDGHARRASVLECHSLGRARGANWLSQEGFTGGGQRRDRPGSRSHCAIQGDLLLTIHESANAQSPRRHPAKIV